MKSLAGEVTHPQGVRLATRRGLPLIIPGYLRLLIEKGDVPAIRVVLTILSMYRVISIPPILKINTITDPFTGLVKSLPIEEINRALSGIDFRKFKLIPNAKLLQSVTAGPNYHTSGLGGILDAIAFKYNHPELLSAFETVCKSTGITL
jgi:hypothetical protein